LHGLTPSLASLQDQGYKIGLVTDGRMSGASGKVPNAIHLTPESLNQGAITKIRDGDIIELDLENGILRVLIDEDTFAKRKPLEIDLSHNEYGFGRELFANFRINVTTSETGATAAF
ncbi:MAG: dihydroxy-acid dehydratase, partial [Burkholderiales bacterium]|nr:dihydroxy-acid dehydratase [Burkholderiales bacterium]